MSPPVRQNDSSRNPVELSQTNTLSCDGWALVFSIVEVCEEAADASSVFSSTAQTPSGTLRQITWRWGPPECPHLAETKQGAPSEELRSCRRKKKLTLLGLTFG